MPAHPPAPTDQHASDLLSGNSAQHIRRNIVMVGASVHSDSYSYGYQPTSPLSPRISAGPGSFSSSTQSGRSRSSQSKPNSRGFRLDLPTYPGVPTRGHIMSPSSTSQSPSITLNRGTPPLPMDTPRLMREKQKELIARAQLSSKIAASPMSAKPDRPRLDPLDGPKGPVTPLALEDAADYFAVTGAGRFSPATSPGARSSRSSTASGQEDKMMKKHKMAMYQ